jgi:hypothetical protein
MGILKRYFFTIAALVTGLFLLAGRTSAEPSREYDLKAVFLYNFASFVDWPDSAFAGPQAPFVVGILGQDPFGPVLDEVVAGERVRDRPLVLRRFSRVEEVRGCHILFVAPSERRQVNDVLSRLKEAPVLTVADFPGFTEVGGGIGFRTEENRLKIDVNAAVLRAAGLTVSSKLLKVARVIGDPHP